jgi:hypothetical protein
MSWWSVMRPIVAANFASSLRPRKDEAVRATSLSNVNRKHAHAPTGREACRKLLW